MGRRLASALADAGHEIVAPLAPADLALVDHDVPWGMWSDVCDNHARVVVYPHGGGLCASGDGQTPVHPNVVARVEMGEGQAQLLGECGYPRPVYVVGCTMCDPEPWRPIRHSGARLKVLFAPDHQDPEGASQPRLRAILKEQVSMEVTVREPALVPDPGDLPPWDAAFGPWTVRAALEAIDGADLVVSNSTFAAAALAKGVPTVMFDQHDGVDSEAYQPAHPELWWPLRYPVDASTCDNGGDLLAAVALAANENVIRDWRREFVGGPFDPDAFVKIIESL